MKLSCDWLAAPSLRAVFAAFDAAGHRAYLVGGAVRNAVLGQAVHDMDLATAARPQEVLTLARAAGLKAVGTGLEHGTVTIIANGVPHEVTSFRADVETDGRRARVAFTDDMAEDARRRDFTMNALYADATGRVIDPLGGLPDALAGRVRFIEDADQRIQEDYLRILRFFRFSAWYGVEHGIDAEGLAAVARHVDGLDGIARERIGAEMLRLLGAPDPAPAMAAMRQAGVLARVLPGADDAALAPLVHHEDGIAPDALRRLAVLGGVDVADALRLSRQDARRLTVLRDGIGAPAGAGELGYRHGVQTGLDILLLRAAVFTQPLMPDARAALMKGAKAKFPISAADLMPHYCGPSLGAKLAELESRWIASDFTATRADLL